MEVTSYLLGKKSGGGGSTLQDKQVTITENGTTNITADTGYDGLNEIAVTTNVSSSIDDYFSQNNPGYIPLQANYYIKKIPPLNITGTTSLNSFLNGYRNLIEGPLMNTSEVTAMNSCFYDCRSMKRIPQYNTSKTTNMSYMCNDCYELEDVPLLDTSKVTNLSRMFFNCYKLSDQSIDNILQMCIGATSYTGTKTLAQLGFTNTYQKVARIQALPHYQDFIDAGWTIGY